MIFDLDLIINPRYYGNPMTSEKSNDNQDDASTYFYYGFFTTSSNFSPFLDNFILDII